MRWSCLFLSSLLPLACSEPSSTQDGQDTNSERESERSDTAGASSETEQSGDSSTQTRAEPTAHSSSENGGTSPTTDGHGDATSGDDSNGDAASNGADTTLDCLPFAEWQPISADGIEWSEGITGTPPTSAVGLFRAGQMYVLDFALRLWTLDPCANRWRSVEVDWTAADLTAALGTASITGTLVHQGQFVVIGDGTDDVVGLLDPLGGSFTLGSNADYQSPKPTWELTGEVVERVAFHASGPRYDLHWGGHTRLSASTTPEDVPLYEPKRDGQRFDHETGQWAVVSSEGAPSPRYLPNLVTIGERFLVWGGYAAADRSAVVAGSELNDGAIYDPRTDEWLAVAASDVALVPTSAPSVDRSPWFSAGTEDWAIFVAPESGQGTVLHVGEQSWLEVTPFEEVASERFEVGSNGTVFNLGSTFSNVLDPKSGTWSRLDYGVSHAGLESANWTIDVWTGDTLIRWGAYQDVSPANQCANTPPNVGCDPYVMYQSFAKGGMLKLVE